ncbi:MAG TPA: hypothetical protein VL947_06495 [Cytophagales bacterium]|nr:hypothetical protein [Cytophagales bacterium]
MRRINVSFLRHSILHSKQNTSIKTIVKSTMSVVTNKKIGS